MSTGELDSARDPLPQDSAEVPLDFPATQLSRRIFIIGHSPMIITVASVGRFRVSAMPSVT
jgi:hypothetical protein